MSFVALRTFALRRPWAVILALVLLAYWPLSTSGYSLPQGDTLDCWLPWRFFIASCLQDGHFPLWNPLQQMGYPIYADLQGPAWYVEAIALGGTIGHSLHVLQALFLGYLVIGGLGMRRLSLLVHGAQGPALLAGVAYALSGFFTGHTMHFYAVISAAWLPWSIEAQLRLMRAPHWRPALSAAVFQALLLTGGNHTFTILVAYLLLALFVVHAVKHWKAGGGPIVRRLVMYEVVFAGATMAMACGTLYAAWEVMPYLGRAEGLDLATAAGGPFTWRACISFLLPFTTGPDAAFAGTDPTMANGYVGLLIAVFAVLALFRKRTAVENTLLGFAGVCFLAAFGDALFVHRLLWSVLPGLDLFRFPSYFLWGMHLALPMLAAGTLAGYGSFSDRQRRIVLGLLGGSVVVLLLLLIWAWSRATVPHVEASLFERLRALSTAERILLNGPVTLAVISVVLWMALRRKLTVRWVGILVMVEMTWSTGLSAWNTSVSDLAPAALESRYLAFDPGAPGVPLQLPMGQWRDDAQDVQPLWRNVQVFKGHPTHDGFNSFQLKHTMALQGRHGRLLEAMKRQPLLYLSDSVVTMADHVAGTVRPERDSALVVVEGPVPLSVRPGGRGTVELAGFEHDAITARVTASGPLFLVVQQAWFPGWSMWVDGAPVDLVRANIAAFGAVVPAGEHRVEARFAKPAVPLLLAVSLLSLILVLGALVITGSPSLRIPRIAGLAVLVLMLLWSLFGHRSYTARLAEDLQQWSVPKNMPVIVSTDRPSWVKERVPDARVFVRVEHPTDLPALEAALGRTTGTHAQVWCVGLGLPPGARTLLNDMGWHVASEVPGKAAVRYTLVRQMPGREGHQVFRDELGGGKALVPPGDPFTTAFRIRVGDLDHAEGEVLAVDLRYKADLGAHGLVVIERKRDGRTTFYEAVPFQGGAMSDTAWSPVIVLRDRRELREPDEELGIYVWNSGDDTLWVKDLRVRMVRREIDRL